MHIHILGVCGTFMGGIAALAKAMGHHVTGSDAAVYPPMSDQLAALGIEVYQGYDPAQLEPQPDLVIIGNVLSRGNPAVEAVLNQRIPFRSGAQWLHDALLQDKWVLAVAGTHGKTTTASMLAWILAQAGYQPGFLVGGVLANFGCSAQLGASDFFVIEADEYDTAFFDKRSKFVHYQPSTLILNNLEFDHADIFPDLAAIQTQFHHLVRIVPGYGKIISPAADTAIEEVLKRGCWSERSTLAVAGTLPADWQFELMTADASRFSVERRGENGSEKVTVQWDLVGEHNASNAVMAMAAAHHVGVPIDVSATALAEFKNTKRRLELLGTPNGIAVYDDFAHHPTAIATTLKALRAKVGSARIVAVLEPRSNTMKQGIHAEQLDAALTVADTCFMLEPDGLQWSIAEYVPAATISHSVDELVEQLMRTLQAGDQVLIMSNGGFGGLHQRLLNEIAATND
ncbi:UDP-N-acetylmuramate--L-alanyl-gamma-D-glutamyl-meso-2,6-diaminoheptandioate ligase [Pseudidiomarina piscicola]|uniref:UDP-N-acetylmuramate--L-alanyl-gamma-D-glutamyl-meso-2,6-diaminoheptandioate ligase n=1 Tax=Pseudidiomarina piscicola TaxID=2614830 RepID=A0A6S6WVJ6_9GAMM|nr:UDP-N-acetylmuramate:L-alanyl-gamma-D-glutamyl-meso-diaminopimelate ligase [Pseudidiomarina piscicola]CAB0151673.1 UDP-N-acetylmuramate--L-alanyl-gamma-D-glutamyl-meso-2,6-diaminoheptandioate ligase [Pseudidiomarina piscicola]VZT41138.1 UDP-N-acetylmuramate--L-alanyl-gamma-D-glutamyl-meso-2,6-diaminoheptandioate ligase [Pseudomonas aeruginosa]